LGEFRGKIEILSTLDVLCWNFAAVSRRIATCAPSALLTHDAAGVLLENTVAVLRWFWLLHSLLYISSRDEADWLTGCIGYDVDDITFTRDSLLLNSMD